MAESHVIYQRSIDSVSGQPDFAQFRHLSMYEMAWSYCFLLEWEKAIGVDLVEGILRVRTGSVP